MAMDAEELVHYLVALGMENPSPFSQIYLRALVSLMTQIGTDRLVFTAEELLGGGDPKEWATGIAVAVTNSGQIALLKVANPDNLQGITAFPSGPGPGTVH